MRRAEKAKMAPDTGEALTHFQATENVVEFRYKSGISGRVPLRCAKANACTYKIVGTGSIRVSAKHGHWQGYNTEEALAWLIEVAPGRWLARCKDRACGPASFNEAKRDALAMAKGALGEDIVRDPIAYLHRIEALEAAREDTAA